MYKVIKIYKGAATSFIDLLNLDTGTIDKVFDDSSVVSYDDFEFIKEGGVYDCKIELLDGFESEKTKTSVELKILDPNAIVGNTRYWKVAIGNDVYYVPLSQTNGVNINGKLYYTILRKDLIQVDDVIHADCL
jgi:hypothetical protein